MHDQEIMRFTPRNWSNSWMMFWKKNWIARWPTLEKINKSADSHLEQINKSALKGNKSALKEKKRKRYENMKELWKYESALKAWKRFESLNALLKMHKCPEIIAGANFSFENSAYWTIIMHYAYCLEKSLLQMILQTYLNYYTHFKADDWKTTTILESWILLLLACKSSQQSVLPLILLECFFSMCLKVWSPPSVDAEWGEGTQGFLI